MCFTVNSCRFLLLSFPFRQLRFTIVAYVLRVHTHDGSGRWLWFSVCTRLIRDIYHPIFDQLQHGPRQTTEHLVANCGMAKLWFRAHFRDYAHKRLHVELECTTYTGRSLPMLRLVRKKKRSSGMQVCRVVRLSLSALVIRLSVSLFRFCTRCVYLACFSLFLSLSISLFYSFYLCSSLSFYLLSIFSFPPRTNI